MSLYAILTVYNYFHGLPLLKREPEIMRQEEEKLRKKQEAAKARKKTKADSEATGKEPEVATKRPKVNDANYYHYDVSITPEVTPKKAKKSKVKTLAAMQAT